MSGAAARRRRAAPADLAAGALATALGGAFLIGAYDIPVAEGALGGPHVVPLGAAWALTLLGAAILIGALLSRAAARGPVAPPSLVTLLILLGGIAYTALIDGVGYLPATLLTAPLAFIAFGGRGLFGAIIPGVAAALAIYAVFFVALGVYDPPGRLVDMRALLAGWPGVE